MWNENGFIIEINASNRGLTGELDVSGLTELHILNLSHNQITKVDLSGLVIAGWVVYPGDQWTEISSLYLDRLDLSHNQITKVDFPEVDELYLDRLNLSHNRLTFSTLHLPGDLIAYFDDSGLDISNQAAVPITLDLVM